MIKIIFVSTCLFLAIPCQAEVIVCFPMESNPNWTTEGQWEFGVPQGGGGPQSYDPTSGHTGANVYGYNLAGNYENNIPEYCLTTSALNCALAENVKLSFWRWLGVESSLFDHAKVQVSNDDANWIDVWVNGEDNLADSSWVYCEYDISVVADRQPTVFIRWCMGTTDFSNAYAGWNIDDVCLNGDILDALFISPSDNFLSFGPDGGPFSPAYKSYTLTNEGTSALNWTAEGTQSWLDVTPGSGTLTPGASVVVELCLNSTADTLAEGKYTDTVSFTNTNSGFSHLIDVVLYVAEGLCVPLQYPTIQSAINASSNGDTIVVLDGTYTGAGNRDINFNGREITLKSVNGPESCIINCGGSSLHPHRGFSFESDEDSNSVLDGFTITGGYVCGPGAGIYCVNSSPTINNCIISGNYTDAYLGENACGGGIYCENSSPIISNCIIVGNRGGNVGGGLYCGNNSSPVITNCIIRDNVSFTPNITGAGGGMYNNSSNPILTNCTFSGNRSVYGAGLVNNSSSPVLTNCMFSRNYATLGSTSHHGGAMYNNNSNPTLTNCTFIGNWAEADYQTFGGGIYNRGGAPTLTNCTFFGNWVSSPDAHGGGIYNWEGKPKLTNCILWGNSDEGGMDESAQIYTTGVGGPVINYSCIQGLDTFAGHGNIGEDPCFADSSNDDYHPKSRAGRWEPSTKTWVQDDVNSPCIDKGDPNLDWTKELWPHGKRINMGAYGGTPEASMSLSDIGNIANLDNDVNDIVNTLDLAMFVGKWCYEEFLLAEDLNRDGFVDFDDFAIFGLQWSYPIAFEPGMTFHIGDCNMDAGLSWTIAAEPNFSIWVEGRYIHFEDQMYANCCPEELGLDKEINGNEITLYEIGYGGFCYCMCYFPITATLGPFEDGTYTVEVYDNYGNSLGIVEVTIGGITEPGITYQIEDCNRQASDVFAAEPPELTRFTATVEGPYIHFKDKMTANCCPDKLELEMTVEDSLITIQEIEYTYEGCRCICSFPVTATLGPFEPGIYTLEVYETMGGLIGATTITIGPDG